MLADVAAMFVRAGPEEEEEGVDDEVEAVCGNRPIELVGSCATRRKWKSRSVQKSFSAFPYSYIELDSPQPQIARRFRLTDADLERRVPTAAYEARVSFQTLSDLASSLAGLEVLGDVGAFTEPNQHGLPELRFSQC